jgi:two-component system KDP operon response regulator KdpE
MQRVFSDMASYDGVSQKILIVDDDRSLQRAMRIGLSARGYTVIEAHSGKDGIVHASLSQPDAIILDLGLPDTDGTSVCKEIRTWSPVPIIVLSAVHFEAQKVAVLDAGADDYVTKPFGMAEFEARLRAVLRRGSGVDAQSNRQTTFRVGNLKVDLVHHTATVTTQLLQLTKREILLLGFLAQHEGKICTHQMILKEVWGTALLEEAHYVRVYVSRLRKKLGKAETLLITHPGLGYELRAPG